MLLAWRTSVVLFLHRKLLLFHWKLLHDIVARQLLTRVESSAANTLWERGVRQLGACRVSAAAVCYNYVLSTSVRVSDGQYQSLHVHVNRLWLSNLELSVVLSLVRVHYAVVCSVYH